MPIERDQGGHKRSTAGSRVWHYNYFRSYSAERGRYTQADPIGLDGGFNRFGYVEGDALNNSDPSGLCVGPLAAGCVWALANAPWLVPTGVAVAEAGLMWASGAFSPGTAAPAAISGLRTTAQAARMLMNSPAAEMCVAKSAAPTISRILPGSLPASEEAALLSTLGHIDAATKPVGALSKKWGVQFKNWNGDLPGAQGAASMYREYRVAASPGVTGAGTNRVVVNSQTGEIYFTWTHYGDTAKPAFVQVR